MKIAIVGAGIAGIATAFELLEAGNEVSVFEQHRAAGEEASFAPSGLMWPCAINPWGATAFHQALQLGLTRPAFSELQVQGGMLSGARRWARRQQALAKKQRDREFLPTLQALELLAMQRMQHVQEMLDISAQFSQGLLLPLRKEPGAAALYELTRRLSAAHIDYRRCNEEETRSIEPGLATDIQLAGAIHLPEAWSGNGRLFSQGLLQALQTHGLQVHTQHAVSSISSTASGASLQLPSGEQHFDAVVLCAGTDTNRLLRPHHVQLPSAPIYSYSASIQISEESLAPRHAVIDLENNMILTRQGSRLRISGGAELGYPESPERTEDARHALVSVLLEWFPGCIQPSQSILQMWRGARLTVADGLPVVGGSGIPHIWLNTAHGGLGWGLSMGCAHHVRQCLMGQSSSLDPEALELQRLR